MPLINPLQKILDRTKAEEGIRHAFYSEVAARSGEETRFMFDDVGEVVQVNNLSGYALNDVGEVIPDGNSTDLAAPADTYAYLGHINKNDRLVRRVFVPNFDDIEFTPEA